MTYDTFSQILVLAGQTQLEIDYIINSLKPPSNMTFVAHEGSVLCY
jgi:hypothetical protein